jgi:DNA-binding transcriptional MerR regulator
MAGADSTGKNGAGMSERTSGPPTSIDAPSRGLRIGEVAERVGASTRTLRYYEELGLLEPSGYSQGGERRYGSDDVQRVLRIRELQSLMGFNLEEIGSILGAEDRVEELRSEYRRGVSDDRYEAMLVEAAALNARTLERVLSKLILLETFQTELEDKALRYQRSAADHGIDLDAALRRAAEGEQPDPD